MTAKILDIPAHALVVLMGVAGSGKSTFARAHFRPTEILSSDSFRAMVSDDEGDQEATADAFTLLYCALEKRLQRGKVSVVDATNIHAEYRARLLGYAQRFQRPVLAVILDTPERICVERANNRRGRIVSPEVVQRQMAELAPQLADLSKEGFVKVFRFSPTDKVETRRSG